MYVHLYFAYYYLFRTFIESDKKNPKYERENCYRYSMTFGMRTVY